MPLSINVGLSRKASKDYQSTGVAINVTAELDQCLLARPDELQRQIEDLYAQARHAMERQAARMSQSACQRASDLSANVQDDRNRSGHRACADDNRPAVRSSLNTPSSNTPAMSESQRRAIWVIASRVGVDPAQESRDVVGADLETMSIRQASQLIDHLKSMQSSGNGH